MNTEDYSLLSLELTKNLHKDVRKQEGIYFTPNSYIKIIIDNLIKYINLNNLEILETSIGSGQFFNYLMREFPNNNYLGIEKNKLIFDKIKNDFPNIINEDFLKIKFEKSFDLIIGNPPYYVINKKEIDKKYFKLFDGRPNIYIIFIIKSLELLKENGILAFIIPQNFLNCLYYNKLRFYINSNFTILNIINIDKCLFIDTEQPISIFIIKKTKTNKNEYQLIISNEFIIFSDKISNLKELVLNSSSLDKLGFNVSIGNIVWNQRKDLLTDDKTKTLLIYNTNLRNEKKKNYINLKGNNEIIIIISRGYGNNYKFNYLLLDINEEYLLENHIIQIKKNDYEKYTKEELLDEYNKIIKSFKNPKTEIFIKNYFKNNAINATELRYIFPIYL